MAVFTDDFERANGALGGNWTASSASVQISNGYVVGPSSAIAYALDSTVGDGGRHQCTATLVFIPGANQYRGPIVKGDPSTGSGYSAFISYSSPTYTLNIRAGSLGGTAALASVALDHAPAGIYTITLVWDNGELTATIPDLATLTASDATYASNAQMGMRVYNSPGQIASITMIGGDQPAFSVSPDVIGNFGQCTELTFTGTGTSWTPGTPGAPIFTVDHGTLSDQEVIDETHATATYCPGDYLGPVTFTDPSTGETDTAIVTSDTGIVEPPGGNCPFTPQAVAMVNNTAGESWLETLTKPSTPISVSGGATLELDTVLGRIGLTTSATVNPESPPQSDLLGYLWLILNGGYDPAAGPYVEPTFATTDAGLTVVRNLLNNLTSNDTITLLAVVSALKGSPGKTLQEVYDHVGGGGGADLTPVLDKLSLIQPGESPSLDDLASLIQELSTIAGYTLGDVMDHLRAIRTPAMYTFASVLNNLDEMRGDAQTTLHELRDLLLEAHQDWLSTQNLLNTIRAEIAAREAEIISLINSLAAAMGAAFGAIPYRPYWPGSDHVDYGAAVRVENNLTIAAVMDGVLVEIEGADPGTAFFDYDATRAYRNIGALSFFCDIGAHETYQALAFPSHIYTPQNFRRAAGVRFHLGRGARGWVTPWTIKPGG